VKAEYSGTGVAYATTNAGGAIGEAKELGAGRGYFADLVAVEGDPLTTSTLVLDNVKWVNDGGPARRQKKALIMALPPPFVRTTNNAIERSQPAKESSYRDVCRRGGARAEVASLCHRQTT